MNSNLTKKKTPKEVTWISESVKLRISRRFKRKRSKLRMPASNPTSSGKAWEASIPRLNSNNNLMLLQARINPRSQGSTRKVLLLVRVDQPSKNLSMLVTSLISLNSVMTLSRERKGPSKSNNLNSNNSNNSR